VNRRDLEFSGLTLKDIHAADYPEKIWHPDDWERFRREREHAIAKGDPWEAEARLLGKDGQYRWFLIRINPLRDGQGHIVRWYGTRTDIEDRKRAEEALRRTEYYLTEGERLTHTGSYAWNAASGLVHVSAELLRIYGFAPEEPAPVHAVFRQRVHPGDGAMFDALSERSIREGADLDWVYRIVLPDGTLKYLHVVARPVYGPSGEVVGNIGTTHDVTDRKRAEESLRRSEAYLAEAQRLTRTGSFASDSSSLEIRYWSEEDFHIWGFDPQQGTPTREKVLQRIHPEDREKLLERVQKARHERTDYATEFRIVLPDGTVKHIHAIGHPIFSASGELIEVVGTHVDITERKLAEQERERLRHLEAELAHINRVTMMGELSASLAHEIKQPIAAAITNAEACLRLLQRNEPDIAEAQDAAFGVAGCARRAAEVIDRVRSLFLKNAAQYETLDVNKLIRDIVILLRNEASQHSVSVHIHLAEKLPAVMGDHVQLQQVVMNLMINGIEAMRDAPGELNIASQLTEDGHVLVSVRDTGIGFPPEKADKLFDAFFTTKPEGTGMGLAISRSIVESHGGRIWAEANSGRGATFRFTLPHQMAERT